MIINSNLDRKNNYDLFCLINKLKVNEFVDSIKRTLCDENLQLKLENFDMAYSIKEFDNNFQYLTLLFCCSSKKVNELEKSVLSNFSVRYILLNQKKNSKQSKIIKLKPKKTVE